MSKVRRQMTYEEPRQPKTSLVMLREIVCRKFPLARTQSEILIADSRSGKSHGSCGRGGSSEKLANSVTNVLKKASTLVGSSNDAMIAVGVDFSSPKLFSSSSPKRSLQEKLTTKQQQQTEAQIVAQKQLLLFRKILLEISQIRAGNLRLWYSMQSCQETVEHLRSLRKPFQELKDQQSNLKERVNSLVDFHQRSIGEINRSMTDLEEKSNLRVEQKYQEIFELVQELWLRVDRCPFDKPYTLR